MDPRKIFQWGKNCAWVGGGGGPWGLQRHHGRDVWRQGGLPMTTWWHHHHHHRHQCTMCSFFSIYSRATKQAQTYLKTLESHWTYIRIRPKFWVRIVFVFVFVQKFGSKYYSYSYWDNFLKSNIIRIWVIFQTEYYLYSYSGDCLKLKATGIFFWIL